MARRADVKLVVREQLMPICLALPDVCEEQAWAATRS